jgi:uncharacterized protein (DUF4415 family)
MSEKDQTDWTRIDEMTNDEIEESCKSDPDWADIPNDWFNDAELVFVGKVKTTPVSLRIPRDILHEYRKTGKGWQYRMIKALRSGIIKLPY